MFLLVGCSCNSSCSVGEESCVQSSKLGSTVEREGAAHMVVSENMSTGQ